MEKTRPVMRWGGLLSDIASILDGLWRYRCRVIGHRSSEEVRATDGFTGQSYSLWRCDRCGNTLRS